MEIVSCCLAKSKALSPQKNPRLTLSTKNSMNTRAATAEGGGRYLNIKTEIRINFEKN
jgi:hypothetical protein